MQKESLLNRVNKGLESIRPFLATDGGDLKLIKITSENIVFIEFQGACRTCNVNQMTLKLGIEESVKKYAPEIVSVQTIDQND